MGDMINEISFACPNVGRVLIAEPSKVVLWLLGKAMAEIAIPELNRWRILAGTRIPGLILVEGMEKYWRLSNTLTTCVP